MKLTPLITAMQNTECHDLSTQIYSEECVINSVSKLNEMEELQNRLYTKLLDTFDSNFSQVIDWLQRVRQSKS